jgi:hypothetical protein
VTGPSSPRGERAGTPGALAHLLHLVDRAERGVLLPAEAAQLRIAIRALHHHAAKTRTEPA